MTESISRDEANKIGGDNFFIPKTTIIFKFIFKGFLALTNFQCQ